MCVRENERESLYILYKQLAGSAYSNRGTSAMYNVSSATVCYVYIILGYFVQVAVCSAGVLAVQAQVSGCTADPASLVALWGVVVSL